MTGALAPPRPSPVEEPRTPGRWALALQAPGFIVLALGIALGALEGGSGAEDWYPAALFVGALYTLVALLAPPTRVERSRPWNVALILFGAFTLWSYASILWADAPATAWDGANRTLMYWLAVATVGLRPWPAPAARAALAVAGFGGAALAVGVLAVSAWGDEPARLFLGGRLSEPTGYANATANLFLVALFPLVHLALERRWGWPLRAAAYAAACAVLQTAVLTQSRGGAIALAAVTILFVALHPRRFPAIAAFAGLYGLCAIAWSTLVEVREAATANEIGPSLADARGMIAACALAATVLAALAINLLRPLFAARPVGHGVTRRAELALAGAAVVAVVVAVGAALSTGWLDDRWHDFKTQGYEDVERGETRFGGALGSGRYDYYRVAWSEFADHPVAGIGADNFAIPYLRERRTGEAPAYPHSLGFRVLAQLGVIGTLLFVGFVGAVCWAFAGVRRRSTRAHAGVVVGAFCGGAVWLVHGLADWLWEFPALSLVALALLAIAARAGTLPAQAPSPTGGWRARAGTRLALGAGAVAATVSLALPGAAARYGDAGRDSARSDPDQAMRYLDRAADLNTLDPDPLISRAVIARDQGDVDTARRDLEAALEREERNWFAHFELGLLAAVGRDAEGALAALRRARELNPRQPLIAEVTEAVRAGRRINAAEVERRLYSQLASKLSPVEAN